MPGSARAVAAAVPLCRARRKFNPRSTGTIIPTQRDLLWQWSKGQIRIRRGLRSEGSLGASHFRFDYAIPYVMDRVLAHSFATKCIVDVRAPIAKGHVVQRAVV